MRRIDKEDLPYPWEIYFSRWQFEWLLSPMVWNFIKIRQWPFHITDAEFKNAGFHHAGFEAISLVKAEVEVRLESVNDKRDGDLCMARYYNEYEDERIARMFGIPYERVSKRIKRAMIYMTGKRKSVTYDEWIKNGWNETPNPRRKPVGFLGNSSFGSEKKTFHSCGQNEHKHFYKLDRNSFGICECGATKQFPVERTLKVNPKIITPPKYDPDAWLHTKRPEVNFEGKT